MKERENGDREHEGLCERQSRQERGQRKASHARDDELDDQDTECAHRVGYGEEGEPEDQGKRRQELGGGRRSMDRGVQVSVATQQVHSAHGRDGVTGASPRDAVLGTSPRPMAKHTPNARSVPTLAAIDIARKDPPRPGMT